MEHFTPYTCCHFKVSENLTQRNLKSSLTPLTHARTHTCTGTQSWAGLDVSSPDLVQDISGCVCVPHLSFCQCQAESCIAPSGHGSGLDTVQKSLSLAPTDLCVPLTGLHDRDILRFLWSAGILLPRRRHCRSDSFTCPLALSPLTAAAMWVPNVNAVNTMGEIPGWSSSLRSRYSRYSNRRYSNMWTHGVRRQMTQRSFQARTLAHPESSQPRKDPMWIQQWPCGLRSGLDNGWITAQIFIRANWTCFLLNLQSQENKAWLSGMTGSWDSVLQSSLFLVMGTRELNYCVIIPLGWNPSVPKNLTRKVRSVSFLS